MNIIAVAGSLRKESFNRKLLANALPYFEGHTVDVVDLKTIDLPVYDGDSDVDGGPESAKKISERFKAAQALVFATPEYNHGIPGGLKNMIDWVSRSKDKPLQNKTAFIMGASTGGFGAIRAIYALRTTLLIFNIITIPRTVMLSAAHQAFDEEGKLKDEKIIEQIKSGCSELVSITSSIKR